MLRRTFLPALALLLAGTVAPAAVAAERPVERRGPATVTFSGTGWGHGVGLSQYGARNRANEGQTYRQILRAYYPGTRWGRAGGVVRVKITWMSASIWLIVINGLNNRCDPPVVPW